MMLILVVHTILNMIVHSNVQRSMQCISQVLAFTVLVRAWFWWSVM